MNTRFRSALHAHLHDQLPGLSAAVKRLHEAARLLPEEIAASLVGGSASLRAAIRSRLRASLVPIRQASGFLIEPCSVYSALPVGLGTVWSFRWQAHCHRLSWQLIQASETSLTPVNRLVSYAMAFEDAAPQP